jgi:hypothetical protein
MSSPTQGTPGSLRQEWRSKCETELVAVWEVTPAAGPSADVGCPTYGEGKNIPGRVRSCARKDGDEWTTFPAQP